MKVCFWSEIRCELINEPLWISMYLLPEGSRKEDDLRRAAGSVHEQAIGAGVAPLHFRRWTCTVFPCRNKPSNPARWILDVLQRRCDPCSNPGRKLVSSFANCDYNFKWAWRKIYICQHMILKLIFITQPQGARHSACYSMMNNLASMLQYFPKSHSGD